MRVLILHSPYFTGPVSGENRVVDDEARLLREGGHTVTLFRPERKGSHVMGAVGEGLSAIWSRSAVRTVARLILQEEPEVVHCHNLFPALSPAVLRAARHSTASVVVTLHNYRLLCLPATLLRGGKVCEKCLGRLPWRGVVHRCYRGSTSGSAALAVSLGLHEVLGSFREVDLYLAVSDFVRGKHLEAGLPPDVIDVKRSFAWSAPRRHGAGGYFLFAGRLSPEKDVATLLEAFRGVGARLVLVGDGPDHERLRVSAPPGVAFLGAVPPDEVNTLLADARAMVVPSLSYEGAPRSVLEAYAVGVPVIANRVGALPEFVEDGVSGLLVKPRDQAALAVALERLLDDSESVRLGSGAWESWNKDFSPAQGLHGLETAYARALVRKDRRTAH